MQRNELVGFGLRAETSQFLLCAAFLQSIPLNVYCSEAFPLVTAQRSGAPSEDARVPCAGDFEELAVSYALLSPDLNSYKWVHPAMDSPLWIWICPSLPALDQPSSLASRLWTHPRSLCMGETLSSSLYSTVCFAFLTSKDFQSTLLKT